jgi:hypothetical protein
MRQQMVELEDHREVSPAQPVRPGFRAMRLS